jgi:hypothetical protein
MRAGVLARVMGESARKEWGKVKAKVDGRVDDGWGGCNIVKVCLLQQKFRQSEEF